MPKLVYRGVITAAFARIPSIPSGGILEGDPSPVGVLTNSSSITTSYISAPGNGNLVGPQTFYHFLNGQWNRYTITNDSTAPRTMTSNGTGLIMNGHLVTMGATDHFAVNDTPLSSSFTGSSKTFNDLAIAQSAATGIPGVTDTGNSMLVTLFPGDLGSFGWNILDFSNGQNILVLYSPSLQAAFGLTPGKMQLGATHDDQQYNAMDVTTGTNYTWCGNGNLQVWTYDRATNSAVFSTYNEAVTIEAPGTGISMQKATPYGFLFSDATLGLCLADKKMENYWQLVATGLPGRAYQMTMDASGFLYVSLGDGTVYATPVPYYAVVGGGGGGGWTGIPAGGAPVSANPGADPHIVLQMSDDGGRTWGIERRASIGKVGQYRRLVRWRRLGQSDNRVFRVINTEPVQSALIECDLDSSAS